MVALVVLRNKAIKPLLAAAQDLHPSRRAQNPRPLDRNYETIRTAMQSVFHELGRTSTIIFSNLAVKRLIKGEARCAFGMAETPAEITILQDQNASWSNGPPPD
jgi:hypothetical protein